MSELKKLLILTMLLLTSACDKNEGKPLRFSARVAYENESLRDFVQIELTNDGEDYICLENTEINGRGGNVIVDNFIVPHVGYPSYVLEKDGVYLGDGITIVGPKTKKGELIELERLTDNTKNIKYISMKLRYFNCEDIFRRKYIPKVHTLSSEWRKSI
ncbi:hypothetical protein [Novosphingobium sp. ERN07]|uniref:hypothetical protein n=1 Tax=Novosphingobium sp. ERN07 TaxID=2726187 RepID=UPI00198254F1|nr:hypothetical protein [Novosphingobium sp. ERN07]